MRKIGSVPISGHIPCDGGVWTPRISIAGAAGPCGRSASRPWWRGSSPWARAFTARTAATWPLPCSSRRGSTARSATTCSPRWWSAWTWDRARASSAWCWCAAAASTARRCCSPLLVRAVLRALRRVALPALRRRTGLLESSPPVVLGEDDLHRLLEHAARRARLAADPQRHLTRVHPEVGGQLLAAALHQLALLEDLGAHFRPAPLLL